MAKLLLVEDDRILAGLVQDCLRFEHHTVEVAHDGDAGLARLQASKFDLVILDWELPYRNGIELLQHCRAISRQTAVLMLTGKGTVQDKELGFRSGADDYLTKPFDMRELIVRVDAILRRTSSAVSAVDAGGALTIGDIVLEPSQFRVRKDGNEIRLTRQEFSLLEFFMRHPGEVFSGEALLDRVWNSESDATVEALRACISRLRKKIDTPQQPSLISNVFGSGYRLDVPAL
jgi:DNA-binding response OmpR family regulator